MLLSMFLSSDPELSALRCAISEASFTDEPGCIRHVLDHTRSIDAHETDIFRHAKTLVSHMRARGGSKGVEAFLHEYKLETQEGVAIMCLAEALLRIPDSETADQLIRGTFSETQWSSHLGSSESLFVNASSWGLMLTGKLVNLQHDNPLGIIGNAIGRLGEPVIREALKAAMRVIGNQFVLGEHITSALSNASRYLESGYAISLDILGEGARTEAQAAAYENAYAEAMDEIARASSSLKEKSFSLSVKLSALHPRLHLVKRDRLHQELLPRLKRILLKARAANIPVSIDAEEASRLDITLELFTALLDDESLKDWDGLGYVVQAYQKRSTLVIDYLAQLARRLNRVIPVRLVKGAYWDSEIKWAQMAGLPDYPVFTRKEHTDACYLACAIKLLKHIDYFYPQFATHNARTAASIIVLAENYGIHHEAFEFQRLHGMGELLHEQLVSRYRCRIYAPVGAHRDLLAYLIRRLIENRANTSFVHLMMDMQLPVEALLTNPIQQCRETNGQPNPHIPLPIHIYTHWQNSRGVDAAYLSMYQALKDSLAAFDNIGTPPGGAPKSGVDAAVRAAKHAQQAWEEAGVEARAAMVENIADSLEAHGSELRAILVHEAGKTYADAIAELREAADFCRYYAYEARQLFATDIRPSYTGERNILTPHGRGGFACISPWNFPLAIFTGQIVAALVTGNSVIAKPAEQTPLIASRAVSLMHEAGVPKAVLQLLPGGGEIGAALVSHAEIDGVVFTGSTETAKHIQRSLATQEGHMVPLIAETGGINCMVVDSSALLEQACDDIITSAFGSAGQRCSALRLLYVQEEVADDLLTLLSGAMQELNIGDPKALDADIGPVIDMNAKQMLEHHISKMQKTAKLVAQAPLDEKLGRQGCFVAPHVFELRNDSELIQEIFGPVLHVVRFKQPELKGLTSRINAKGYGLTFGLHSRIQDHIRYFSTCIHAGNIYINRSMIGAIVGVQPFGGEGLSGTGPKAGGPHYLTRFVVERHVSNNVAAIGGNITLLSQ